MKTDGKKRTLWCTFIRFGVSFLGKLLEKVYLCGIVNVPQIRREIGKRENYLCFQ
jgi:hypothetical protein